MKWPATRKDRIKFGALVCLAITASVTSALVIRRTASRTSSHGMHGSRTPATANTKWRVMHILSTECECSLHVIAHLLQREALANLEEQVVLIQSPDNTPIQHDLTATGYEVTTGDPETLADRFGVAAVPWMIVRNEADKVLYTGGYSAKGIESPADVQDIQVFNALRSSPRVPAFTSHGCATSQRLNALFDPFHFNR